MNDRSPTDAWCPRTIEPGRAYRHRATSRWWLAVKVDVERGLAWFVEDGTFSRCMQSLSICTGDYYVRLPLGAEHDAVTARVLGALYDRQQPAPDPIGDWYADKAREARRLAGELQQAKGRGAPAAELKRIERALESAQYVGD